MGNRFKRRLTLGAVASLAFALALGACATPGHKGGAPFVVPVSADGVQRVEVVGGAYYFEPSRIVVKANVPVELTLRKVPDVLPHDFVLSAPEAGIAVAESLSTEPRVVRFTPTRAGAYPYFCSKNPPIFPSHRHQGMEGVLEVLP
jgi:plastocyanin